MPISASSHRLPFGDLSIVTRTETQQSKEFPSALPAAALGLGHLTRLPAASRLGALGRTLICNACVVCLYPIQHFASSMTCPPTHPSSRCSINPVTQAGRPGLSCWSPARALAAPAPATGRDEAEPEPESESNRDRRASTIGLALPGTRAAQAATAPAAAPPQSRLSHWHSGWPPESDGGPPTAGPGPDPGPGDEEHELFKRPQTLHSALAAAAGLPGGHGPARVFKLRPESRVRALTQPEELREPLGRHPMIVWSVSSSCAYS